MLNNKGFTIEEVAVAIVIVFLLGSIIGGVGFILYRLENPLPTNLIKMESIGTIQSVDYRNAGFGSSAITIITTDQKVVSTIGTIIVSLGEEAFFEYRDDGFIYVVWESSPYKFKVGSHKLGD